MRQAFSAKFGELEDKHIPAKEFIEKKLGELESGEFRAEPLTEIISRDEVDPDTLLPHWDAKGTLSLKKGGSKTAMPSRPEQLRLRLTVLQNTLIMIQLRHGTFALFEKYKEYPFGDYCYGLRFSEDSGSLAPPSSLVLSYEHAIRKHAHKVMATAGYSFGAALVHAYTRLVIPWSLFQYLAMSQRPLSGFQSWGKVGVVYIRRVAQDIIHGAQQRNFMDRIKEVNLGNPWLLDLNSYYPEPSHAETPMSQALDNTITQAKDRPDQEAEEEESDMELTAEERAEVARIEEECSELERRRGVTWTQEEVDGCLTMEQFLDYLEARGDNQPDYNDQQRRDPGDPVCRNKSAGCTTPRSILWDALLYRTEFFDIAYYHRCRAASRS
ncbi:unnamed protein product [Symbiodinium sp. KB8]|nr:unnamed protein product [Symbiodinium sp. KB8]